MANKATILANQLSSDVELTPANPQEDTVESKAKIKIDDVTFEDKISCMKEANDAAQLDGIQSTNITYSEVEGTNLLLSSEGTCILSNNNRTIFSMNAVASNGEVMQIGHKSLGGVQGFEIIKDADLESFGRSISEKEKPTETDIQCFTQQQAVSFLQALDNPMMYEYTQHNRTAKTGNVTQIRSYQAEHTLNNQLKLFLNLAIYTGFMRGELIALTWQDIDFGTDTIHINKSTCRVNGQIPTNTPKTKGSIRSINIPSSVSALAKAWKKEQMEYRFMIGTQWKGGNMDRCNIFIQWDGSQMGLETPSQAFKSIITNYNDHCENESEKLPDIPLHGLRHTSATLLISSRKMDVMTVSKRLGHNNTSTTLNIYAHAYEELDKKAASTLDNLLSNSGQLSL